MFAIYHTYEVEARFGEPVVKEDLIAFCCDAEIARRYAEHFDGTHMYDCDTNGQEMYCGTLQVREVDDHPLIITKDNEYISPWERAGWPENNNYLTTKNNK